MQSTDVRQELDEVRAELETLKARVAEMQQLLLQRIAEAQRHSAFGPSRFLTLRAAARALGLGTARVRQLVAAGALRTIEFPDGGRRVPRSELERIDALGLQATLRPVKAPDDQLDSPQKVAAARAV